MQAQMIFRSKPIAAKPFVIAACSILPAAAEAQWMQTAGNMLPIQMNTPSFLIISFLVVFTTCLLFVFQRRFMLTRRELEDLTGELSVTRQRLVETGQHLEETQQILKRTNKRYQHMLYDAELGIFQIDADGICSFVNSRLEELSGLYAKKARLEGIASAVLEEDRPAFEEAWKAFIEQDIPFSHTFRFQPPRKEPVQVHCTANKIFDAKKNVESYIGWVTDVTAMQDRIKVQEAETSHYRHFIGDTLEGFYHLTPEKPIPVSMPPAKMIDLLLEDMKLADCSDSFAAVYASSPEELKETSISDLPGGCGPFRNAESLKEFIENNYRISNLETVRQDANGNRINLLNQVTGIVEDGCLIGIWGEQRNISKEKRERAELNSQVTFLQRILSALPADVHVKDTRCRYLYASRKLADRTGIPQQDWIGKTIQEVLPGTSRDHDRDAIETMKSNTLSRTERHFEARGKSGWMESIHIPMVSEEGLVEGVIGMALDVTERKHRETEIKKLAAETEKQLRHTQSELHHSREEYAKTSEKLSEIERKLKLAEVEQKNREHEYNAHLTERKRAEEALQKNNDTLLKRQGELEETLERRLSELEKETDKRKKWEELLSIKEREMRKLEEHIEQTQTQYKRETELRSQAESRLKELQEQLNTVQHELDNLQRERETEIETLNARHEKILTEEAQARNRAEKELTKTRDLLQETQEHIKHLTEKHSLELENEIAERKSAAEKLFQNMEELDALRQDFNHRIEEETKSVKAELARKQIREKALREHEQNLEERIKELEKNLEQKTVDFARQVQAREGAEVEKNEIEQKLEMLTKRQQEIVARETQKLNLHIAEIRLDEVKLRKRVGELEERKDELEAELKERSEALEQAHLECRKLEASLSENQARMDQLAGEQEKRIAVEKEGLQQELSEMKLKRKQLSSKLESLQEEKDVLEQKLESRNADLTKAAQEYRRVVDSYKEAQLKFKQHTEKQEEALDQITRELNDQLNHLKASEKSAREMEQQLNDRIEAQQKEISTLNSELSEQTRSRQEAERTLRELQAAQEADQQQTEDVVRKKTQELRSRIDALTEKETSLKQQLEVAEATVQERDKALRNMEEERAQTRAQIADMEDRLADIRRNHADELKKALEETREISRMNSDLVDEVSFTIQQTLNPVVRSTLLLEQSENLSDHQKKEAGFASHCCRRLIDTMNYRSELTHMAEDAAEAEIAECDLHALMTGIDNQFGHRAETKKIFFAVSFAQYQAKNNVPKFVETDEQKLGTLLSILIGYALDRTEKGRLGLHATRKSCDGQTARIGFELAYTGVESRDALLSAVFEKRDESTVVDMKYGLTLAMRYIQMLGGEVHMEYRDGGVTALQLEFPFKKAAAEIEAEKEADAKDEKTDQDGEAKQAGAA